MSETLTIVTRIVKEAFEAFGTNGDYNDLAKKIVDKNMSFSQVLGMIRDAIVVTGNSEKSADQIVDSIVKEEKAIKKGAEVKPIPKSKEEKKPVETKKVESPTEEGVIELCSDDEEEVFVDDRGNVSNKDGKKETVAETVHEESEVMIDKDLIKKDEKNTLKENPAVETPSDPVLTRPTPTIEKAPKKGQNGKEKLKQSFKGDQALLPFVVEFGEYAKKYMTDSQYTGFIDLYLTYLNKMTIGKLEKRNFIAAISFGCLKNMLKTEKPTQREYYEPMNVDFRSLCRSYIKIRELGLDW